MGKTTKVSPGNSNVQEGREPQIDPQIDRHRLLALVLSRIPTAGMSPIIDHGALWDSVKTRLFCLPFPNFISSHSTQVSSKKPFSNHSDPHAFLHPLNSGPVCTARDAGQHLGSCLPTTSGSVVGGPAFRAGSQRPPDYTDLFHNTTVVTAISCANVCADLGQCSRPAAPECWASVRHSARLQGWTVSRTLEKPIKN